MKKKIRIKKKTKKKNTTLTSDERQTKEYNEVGNDACCIAPVLWLLFTIDQQCTKVRQREMMVVSEKGDPLQSVIHPTLLFFLSLSPSFYVYCSSYWLQFTITMMKSRILYFLLVCIAYKHAYIDNNSTVLVMVDDVGVTIVECHM